MPGFYRVPFRRQTECPLRGADGQAPWMIDVPDGTDFDPLVQRAVKGVAFIYSRTRIVRADIDEMAWANSRAALLSFAVNNGPNAQWRTTMNNRLAAWLYQPIPADMTVWRDVITWVLGQVEPDMTFDRAAQ